MATHRDIVRQLMLARAEAKDGAFRTREAERARERATRNKFLRQDEEARIGEEMFEKGQFESLGERISVSKARAMIRELGDSFLKFAREKRSGDATTIIKHIKHVMKDARLTPAFVRDMTGFMKDVEGLGRELLDDSGKKNIKNHFDEIKVIMGMKAKPADVWTLNKPRANPGAGAAAAAGAPPLVRSPSRMQGRPPKAKQAPARAQSASTSRETLTSMEEELLALEVLRNNARKGGRTYTMLDKQHKAKLAEYGEQMAKVRPT